MDLLETYIQPEFSSINFMKPRTHVPRSPSWEPTDSDSVSLGEVSSSFGSQVWQRATEGAAVSGLKVSAGHATHADWFASSL
jgi:hypothetical protein